MPHASRSTALRRVRRFVFTIALVPLLAALVLVAPTGASTPSSGSIDESNPTATWDGPAQTAVTQDQTTCSDPGAYCDEYTLTVNVDPSYWDTHSGGALVEISWDVPTDDYDLYVFQNGTDAGHDGAVGNVEHEQVFLPAASGVYEVRVVYFTTSGASGYTGTATFQSQAGAGGAIFTNTTMTFDPATIVSAHWAAGEPQTTIERPIAASEDGAVDPNRIFVDWPLSSRAQIGQLNRSLDGGKTFRLLYDPTCAQRSRPMCATAGGGDTEEDVNLVNGHVLFSDQEVLANEAYAHSSDHGDTWLEQQAASNFATGVDRQWLTTTDNSFSIGGDTIEGFLTYHVPLAGQYIQAIESTGVALPQPVTQIVNVAQSGQPRVDIHPDSPGYQYLYQPFRRGDGTYVATAFGPDYASPASWHVVKVTSDVATIFPWLAIDDGGNAYLVWVKSGVAYYSVSIITEKDNDPAQGGVPGTSWSPAVRVQPPEVTSSVFPEVIGGADGRIAIAYDGTTTFAGSSNDAPDDTLWNTYAAVITNAKQVGGSPEVTTGIVSHRYIHQGNICTSGTTCLTTGKDRSLLDMIDLSFDSSGRLGVVFSDNYSSFAQTDQTSEDASPFVHFAKETFGPRVDTAATLNVASTTRVKDRKNDATWPNTSEGVNLPALDLFGDKLSVSGDNLVAKIRLNERSMEAMVRDLAAYNAVPQSTPPAQRLQYIVRFSTGTEIYHLSLESLADGTRRCFGGKLDANDQITNPSSGAVVGAGYNTDFDATCSELRTHQIVITAPLSAFGLSAGTQLYSISAFADAGPLEADQSMINPMRTVDASRPYDTTL